MLARLRSWLHASSVPKPNPAIARDDWLIVGVITLAGIVLRFWFASRAAMFTDELYTWAFTQGGPVEAIRQAIADNGPPLYYVLQSIADPGLPQTVFGTRLLATIFSALSVPTLYFLGRQFATKTTASLAAGMLALSPYGVVWTTSARSYALAQLLCLLAALFVMMAARSGRTLHFALYSVCALAAAYTHVFALVACVGIGVGSVIAMPDRSTRLKTAGAMAAWLLLWSPWLQPLADHASEARDAVAAGLWFVPRPEGLLGPSVLAVAQHAPWGGGQLTNTQTASHPAHWVFLGTVTIGAALLATNRGMPRFAASVLGAWVITTIAGTITVSLATSPIFLHHYSLVTAPALFLLAAVALERLWWPVTWSLMGVWLIVGALEMPAAMNILSTTDLTQIVGFSEATQEANVLLVTNTPTPDGMLVSIDDLLEGAWELGISGRQVDVVELRRSSSLADLRTSIDAAAGSKSAVIVVEDQRFVFEGRARFIDDALSASGWVQVRDGVVSVMAAREYRRAPSPK